MPPRTIIVNPNRIASLAGLVWLFRFHAPDRFDDDVFHRNFFVVSYISRSHIANLIHDLHAVDHFAKDGVSGVPRLSIEASAIIDHVDEELIGSAVGNRGPSHGD